MAEISEEAGIFFKTTYEVAGEEAEAALKLPQLPLLLDAFEEKVLAVSEIGDDFGKTAFKEIQTETGYKGKDLVYAASDGADWGSSWAGYGIDTESFG